MSDCLQPRRHIPTLCWIVLAFLAFGWLVDPVPGINEPHYLGKAKHFWDPEWCAGDLFLESANAHVVFYATLGWLSTLLPLPQFALAGRLLGGLVLAWGWEQMLRALTGGTAHVPDRGAPEANSGSATAVPEPSGAAGPGSKGATRQASGAQRPSLGGRDPAVLLASVAYLSLFFTGTLAGEWIVGGIEGKVIAYGLAFAAFGRLTRGDWLLCAGLAGLAVAFHPVAGGWLTAAAAAAVAVEWWPGRCRSSVTPLALPGWKRLLAAAVIWMLAAAPGLVPAIVMLVRSDPVAAWQANLIQVYYRLRHHLDPLSVPLTAWCRYAAMLAAWWVLSRSGLHARPLEEGEEGESPHDVVHAAAARRLMARIVAVALVIAVAAVVTGLPGRPQTFGEGRGRLAFLKLYPLRLLDAILPVALAASAARAVAEAFGHSPSGRRVLRITATAWLLALLALAAMTPPAGRMPRQWQPSWVAMCRWIRDHTPPRALFLTPRNVSRTFKWYAERPEYVNYKDCPQDAASLVEWNRRLRLVQQWASEHYADGKYSAAELAELRRLTGADYLLVRRLGPMSVVPEHVEGPFRLYALWKLDSAGARRPGPAE